jgi:hypothetical protein
MGRRKSCLRNVNFIKFRSNHKLYIYEILYICTYEFFVSADSFHNDLHVHICKNILEKKVLKYVYK